MFKCRLIKLNQLNVYVIQRASLSNNQGYQIIAKSYTMIDNFLGVMKKAVKRMSTGVDGRQPLTRLRFSYWGFRIRRQPDWDVHLEILSLVDVDHLKTSVWLTSTWKTSVINHTEVFYWSTSTNTSTRLRFLLVDGPRQADVFITPQLFMSLPMHQ